MVSNKDLGVKSNKEFNEWEKEQDEIKQMSDQELESEIKKLERKSSLSEDEQGRLESLRWRKNNRENKPSLDEYEKVDPFEKDQPGLFQRIRKGFRAALLKLQPLFWAGGAIALATGYFIQIGWLQLGAVLSASLCVLLYPLVSLREEFSSVLSDTLLFTFLAGIPYYFLLAFLGDIHWMYYTLWIALGVTGLGILSCLFPSVTKLWSWMFTGSSGKLRARFPSVSLRSIKSQGGVRARFSGKNKKEPRARYN